MAAVIKHIAHGLYIPFVVAPEDVADFPRRTACPTCGVAAPFEEILELSGQDWAARIRLVQCRDCHALFYENPPAPEAMADYYQRVWNTRAGERANGAIERRTRTKDRMARLLEQLGYASRSSRILDVGCGLGDLMAGLESAGFTDLWGTEMSPYRVAVTEQRFPGRVFQGGYEAVPDEMRFDVIYCNHVLEHIYQPADAFHWMARHLNKDGIIILSVPDAWSEPVSGQVLFLPHLHSFCARSFDRLAMRNGLEARFWTADRVWDLTAVFGRHLERFPGAGSFPCFAELDRPKEGSLRERICTPWLDSGNGSRRRYLALTLVHKSRDSQQRLAGYRVMNGLELLFAKAQLAALGALRAIGLSRLFKVNAGRVGYLEVRPASDGEAPLIVAAARQDALLQIK